MLPDPGWLFLELVVGGVGFVLLVYGKKQGRLPHVLAGLLFMAYPWFVTSSVGLLVAGALIITALWWAIRLGW